MSNQARVHWGGEPAHIVEQPGTGVLFASGTSVPADGAVGYSPGCIFIQTDGTSATTVLFVNVGTKASANFDYVTIS